MKVPIRAVDLFAGAGGASSGLVLACRELGLDLDLLAIDHWPTAVETHSLNHPQVRHLCEAVERVDPRKVIPSGRLHLLLAGPECTHHSKARGGRPVNDQLRATAWHILKWAQELYIEHIVIENVPEFRQWGPLGANSKPMKSKKGQTYRAFLEALRSLGYRVEDRVLTAADYGDPTIRQRLFILARRGSKPVVWPTPTHSKTCSHTLFGRTERWRPAREAIDWLVPSQSIFTRKRPLKPATLARILAGLEKFGRPELQPFLVVLRNNQTVWSLKSPTPTLTTSGVLGLCEPVLVKDRFGLVQPCIDGYVLDIHFRMLQPHELAAAMSFPESYRFAGTRGDQVKQIGNAWPWRLATALCRTVLEGQGMEEVARATSLVLSATGTNHSHGNISELAHTTTPTAPSR